MWLCHSYDKDYIYFIIHLKLWLYTTFRQELLILSGRYPSSSIRYCVSVWLRSSQSVIKWKTKSLNRLRFFFKHIHGYNDKNSSEIEDLARRKSLVSIGNQMKRYLSWFLRENWFESFGFWHCQQNDKNTTLDYQINVVYQINIALGILVNINKRSLVPFDWTGDFFQCFFLNSKE